LNIWPKARSFNPERSQPKDWIMSVAHHKIMDVIRSRRRTIINTDPADYETLDLQCSDVVGRFQATAAKLAALVVPHDPLQGLPARLSRRRNLPHRPHRSSSWSLQSATG